MADTADAVLDHAWDRMGRTGPEYGGGFSSHGPMAVEALVRMGRPDDAARWADLYLGLLEEPAPTVERIDLSVEASWRAALGDSKRQGDWLAVFDELLLAEDRPWEEVLGHWAPVLLPGAVAAAGHGVIRTAHAVRGLAGADNPVRRHELAHGLAHWAGCYQTLPGTPRPFGSLSLDAAVPALPRPDEVKGFFITQALRSIHTVEAFPAAVDALAGPTGPEDVDAAFCRLTAHFARVFVEGRHAPIVYTHTVTTPAAVRLLLPHLPSRWHTTCFAYAWQACAGLASGFGTAAADDARIDALAAAGDDLDRLVDAAVDDGDEHAIKLTEACLREHAANPDPAYLAAAASATAENPNRLRRPPPGW